MNSKILEIIRIGAGLIVMLFGGLGILLGIIAIIDPVGTKMSDDADPFGVPPTFIESLNLTVIFILIFLGGVGLVVGWKPLVKLFGRRKQKILNERYKG